MSMQRKGSVVGAILATEAYKTAETPETEGAMLAQLSTLDALRSVAVPDWELAAFSDYGRLLAIETVTPDGKQPKDFIVFGLQRSQCHVADARTSAGDAPVWFSAQPSIRSLGFVGRYNLQHRAPIAVCRHVESSRRARKGSSVQ